MLSGKPTLFRAIVLPVVVKVQVWWWSECVRFWKYRWELKYSRLDTRPGPNTNVELGLESWNRSIKWTLEGHLGWHKSYRIRGPIKTPDGRFRIVDDHESKQLLPRMRRYFWSCWKSTPFYQAFATLLHPPFHPPKVPRKTVRVIRSKLDDQLECLFPNVLIEFPSTLQYLGKYTR